ncbi:MAG: hypothetical protein L6Q95_06970, partial [Planctomycetes bacterium]|nr:hypothetical protein [Planctomycetota bacterium]
ASGAGTAPVATLVDQAPAALSGGPDATSRGPQELASTGRKRLSGADASPSLATPPSFPGTLGIEPKLPEGAGSRAMLELQEGHVRQAGALPSVPSGTLKAGMAEASGAEGPRDEQGVGPFGGGGAQYTVSLGLSTPEPMRIDDRGRADVSGYRGKSNGLAHEWAQASLDKDYAYSKGADADTWEEAVYWAERAEDAEIRLSRADEEIDRSGDADTIAKQAWEDKVRLQRREDRARAREAAAARRAAQRLERKGRAWRRNRRHQVNEREKRRDRRRERRLENRLPEASMKRWSDAQKQINTLRDRLEEIENKLDDPRTPPGERAQLEQEKKKTEDQIEEKKLDQYWEEHGGFPCAELDCCDPKYAKCRPPCEKDEKCVCLKPANCPDPPAEKKDEGGDDEGKDKEDKGGKKDEKGPITPGSVSGKQAGGKPGGGGEPPPEVESPDGGADEAEEFEERPDDGRQGKKAKKGAKWGTGLGAGGGDLPLVFGPGNHEYQIYPSEDGTEWFLRTHDGSVFKLLAPDGKPGVPKELYEQDGKTYYDLAGLKRSEERINFLGPLLQGAARKIQDLLGTEAVATLRLVTRQYVDDNLQHLVEQYAREGTIDWGDAGIVIAGAIIPGSLPGGGGKPFKGKSKTTALPGKPKKPPGGSGGGGGGGGEPPKPPGRKPPDRSPDGGPRKDTDTGDTGKRSGPTAGPESRLLTGRAEVEEIYREHPDLAANPDALNDLMAGIDWSKPTVQRTLEPGDIVEQWVWKGGKPGRHFTLPGEDPASLGLKLGENGLPAGRELRRFRVTERVSFVESTAKTIPETPRFPGGPGGGQQLFAERGSASKLVDIGPGRTR